MNYFEAMRLLDRVKEGVPYPVRLINLALELTGDLEQKKHSRTKRQSNPRASRGQRTLSQLGVEQEA